MVNVELHRESDGSFSGWSVAGRFVPAKGLEATLKDYFRQLAGIKKAIQNEKGNTACHIKTWMIRSKTQQDVTYLVTLEEALFSCTCPDFQIRHRNCKHILKVKKQLAGEKQKNKLPGAGT